MKTPELGLGIDQGFEQANFFSPYVIIRCIQNHGNIVQAFVFHNLLESGKAKLSLSYTFMSVHPGIDGLLGIV